MASQPQNFITVDIGFKNLALCFWENGKIVDFSLISLIEGKPTAEKITSSLEKILSELRPRLAEINSAYVERQLGVNTKATRIEAQIEMWFKIQMPHVRYVRFSPAEKYKSCDKAQIRTKTQRKKWASEHAAKFIPPELSQKYTSLNKKDDVGDCVLIGLSVLHGKKVKKHNK